VLDDTIAVSISVAMELVTTHLHAICMWLAISDTDSRVTNS